MPLLLNDTMSHRFSATSRSSLRSRRSHALPLVLAGVFLFSPCQLANASNVSPNAVNGLDFVEFEVQEGYEDTEITWSDLLREVSGNAVQLSPGGQIEIIAPSPIESKGKPQTPADYLMAKRACIQRRFVEFLRDIAQRITVGRQLRARSKSEQCTIKIQDAPSYTDRGIPHAVYFGECRMCIYGYNKECSDKQTKDYRVIHYLNLRQINQRARSLRKNVLAALQKPPMKTKVDLAALGDLIELQFRATVLVQELEEAVRIFYEVHQPEQADFDTLHPMVHIPAQRIARRVSGLKATEKIIKDGKKQKTEHRMAYSSRGAYKWKWEATRTVRNNTIHKDTFKTRRSLHRMVEKGVVPGTNCRPY